MNSTRRISKTSRWLFGSTRRVLVLLIFLAVVPLVLAQIGIYTLWVHSRRAENLKTNLDFAQAVAVAFNAFVRDLGRQEMAIGAALTGPGSHSAAEATEFLKAVAKAYPAVRAWDWVTPEGETLASSDERRIGRAVEWDAGWHRDLLSGRDWVISDLLPNRPVSQPTFLVARRVEAANRALVGMAVAEIDANELGVLALPIVPAEGSMFSVLDRQGNLAYVYPEREVADRNWRASDPILDAVLTRGEPAAGTFFSPFDGSERMAARVPIAETGWVAGASRPMAVLMAPVVKSLWLIGLVNLAVITLSVGASGLLGGHLVRRLRQLQAHAQAVGRGDLGRRSEVVGIRELEQLADSLNRMGASLREAREAQQQASAVLEQRVAERTAELRAANESLRREIVQRKQSQAALAEQSRILEAFFQHTISPLVFLDSDYNFLRVNEAYAKACERDVSDYPGHNHFEFYPSDAKELFDEVVRAKKPCEVFARPFVFPDLPERGVTYWDWTLVPVQDERGEVDFLILSLQDVTERTRAERSLWESEQRYRSLIVATTQIVWTTNARGEVVSDLPSWRQFTGQCLEEVAGWGWSDAVHPDDRQRVTEVWTRSVQRRTLYDTEYRLRRHDGQYRHVSVRGVPVLDSDGTVREWVGTCTDVTERRLAEGELARYREHLEELVTQRTEELEAANRRLEEEIARRKRAAETLELTAAELARSNRELEQFAYIASHDLQEPLRVITGYLQLLERRYEGRFDADADQFIEYAVEGANRMQQLICDLLDYSRVGSRGRPMEPTHTETILQEALHGLEKVLEEANASVTYDPLPTVRADPVQLRQLFQNLISNAIKFHSDRRPEIHVSARQGDGRWQFSVRDNGIGIETQYWDQIFVIFQRLHTRQKYSGTGIGLSLCKKIVERHGGRIWLDSEPGKGTTFHFTI